MTKEVNRIQRKQGLLSKLMSSISFLVTEDTKTQDQRNSPRIECRAEISYVDEHGIKGTGFLIDISKSGLQLETSTKLGKGLTLALNAPNDESLERTTPFMAKVCWSRKGQGVFRAGLALPSGVEDDPHWLESLLHQLGYTEDGSQRRRFIRSDSELSGLLSPALDRENPIPVKVLNMGLGGALLRSNTALPKNLEFYLQIGPYQDLPAVGVEGSVLKVTEKPEEGFSLNSVRFSIAEEKELDILKEYILNISGRSGEASHG